MSAITELSLGAWIQCSSCRVGLVLISKLQTPTLIQDPNFTYYYKSCRCNPDDKRIIRVPLQPVEYEAVEE